MEDLDKDLLHKLCIRCANLVTHSELLRKRSFFHPAVPADFVEKFSHFNTLEDLIASARSGCHLCCLLWDGLEYEHKHECRRLPFDADERPELLETVSSSLKIIKVCTRDNPWKRGHPFGKTTLVLPVRSFCTLHIVVAGLGQEYSADVAIEKRQRSWHIDLWLWLTSLLWRVEAFMGKVATTVAVCKIVKLMCDQIRPATTFQSSSPVHLLPKARLAPPNTSSLSDLGLISVSPPILRATSAPRRACYLDDCFI